MMIKEFLVRIYARVVIRKVEEEGRDIEQEINKLPEEYRQPVKETINTLTEGSD